MRFEEFASKAGRAAADVGRRADRPSLSRIRDRRRRALIVGWSSTVVAALALSGVLLAWAGSGSGLSPAAVDKTTTTLTSTTTMEGVDACPLTTPGDSPFSPPSETPDGSPPSSEAVWYGTPELWTSLHRVGEIWTGLPVAADGSLTQKTFWWSDNLLSITEPVPAIALVAEQLDGSGDRISAAQVTTGGNPEQGVFVVGRFQIPQEGCWRITAEYLDSTLSYVVWAGSD